MFKYLNKGISTPLAIIIIIVLGIFLIGIIFWLAPKEETAILEIENLKNKTSNWETYRNKEYGFLIKYPANWMLEEKENEEGKTVSFKTTKKDKMNVYYDNLFSIFVKETAYTSIQKWVEDTYKDRESTLVLYKEIIVINDNEWLYVNDPINSGGCSGISINLIKNSKLYRVINYCDPDVPEIFSTFRFLK